MHQNKSNNHSFKNTSIKPKYLHVLTIWRICLIVTVVFLNDMNVDTVYLLSVIIQQGVLCSVSIKFCIFNSKTWFYVPKHNRFLIHMSFFTLLFHIQKYPLAIFIFIFKIMYIIWFQRYALAMNAFCKVSFTIISSLTAKKGLVWIN